MLGIGGSRSATFKRAATSASDRIQVVEVATPTRESKRRLQSLDLGRDVVGIEITENPNARDGKPTFLMMGVHHAREWPSSEHTIEFAYDLLRNYGSDTRTTQLVGSTRTISSCRSSTPTASTFRARRARVRHRRTSASRTSR